MPGTLPLLWDGPHVLVVIPPDGDGGGTWMAIGGGSGAISAVSITLSGVSAINNTAAGGGMS